MARHLLASEKHPWSELAVLLGILLIALDPFVLGYSRLMHIAVPLALLMLLTVVAWMLWLKVEAIRWIWLTGLFGGLALLTKSTALILFPILLGLALMHWLIGGPARGAARRNGWKWLVRVFIGWLAALFMAALVFIALWPAMWQAPGTALASTFGKLWVDKEAGQGNLGMFWMGHFVEDPGPAFYVVAALLKLSPLMLVGLVGSLLSLRPARERGVEWGLWMYAILYLLAMTIAAKKSVRYLLPAFAAFGLLAAYGLVHLGRWGSNLVIVRGGSKAQAYKARPTIGRSPRLVVLALLLLVPLAYGPYYLSYFNPLLLGWGWAPKVILVGWGEGMGDAAHFLNREPDAEQSKVAAWYDWTFTPFFVGQTLPMSTENALGADYSVFYINQVQRNIPDPNLITYFQRRRPEHVVWLNGVAYAWIYPAITGDGPLPDSAIPVGATMGDAVVLEGYETRPDREGQGLIVTLYWRAMHSDLPDYFVYVRGVDSAGQINARADSPPVMGFWPTSRWEAGKLVADEQVLIRSPETAPGTYRLEVGMYDPQTWAVLEPATGDRGRGAGGGVLLGEVNLP
jgi:4-amino-4-deoxy-L-arabinose transferase-like glycosyltransferase